MVFSKIFDFLERSAWADQCIRVGGLLPRFIFNCMKHMGRQRYFIRPILGPRRWLDYLHCILTLCTMYTWIIIIGRHCRDAKYYVNISI